MAKVVKGGRRFSFTALVVIGDGNGRVGLGYGKAKEVPLAIQKGTEEAKRNLFDVPMAGSTIIHPVLGTTGGGKVMMKPAAPGTGVIAGGAARVILEEAGVHDVLCKSLGSANHINVARATVAGLKSLQRPDQIARRRGLPAEEFVPKGLLNAYNERQKTIRGGASTAGAQNELKPPSPSRRSSRRSAPSPSTAARSARSVSARSAPRTRCLTGRRSAA